MAVPMTAEVPGKGEGWEQVPISQVSLPRITIQPPGWRRGTVNRMAYLMETLCLCPSLPTPQIEKPRLEENKGLPLGHRSCFWGRQMHSVAGEGEPQVFVCLTIELKEFL